MTQCGVKSVRNPALQRAADLILTNAICCPDWLEQQMQFDRLKRRNFIALLGSAMAAWPKPRAAQPGERVRRIGVLMAHDENDAEFTNKSLF